MGKQVKRRPRTAKDDDQGDAPASAEASARDTKKKKKKASSSDAKVSRTKSRRQSKKPPTNNKVEKKKDQKSKKAKATKTKEAKPEAGGRPNEKTKPTKRRSGQLSDCARTLRDAPNGSPKVIALTDAFVADNPSDEPPPCDESSAPATAPDVAAQLSAVSADTENSSSSTEEPPVEPPTLDQAESHAGVNSPGIQPLAPRDLERHLRQQLGTRTLVCELDLDSWGPQAESALKTSGTLKSPSSIARTSPATLVTYLAWQGRHNYVERTFWPNVSITQLRSGGDSGRAFERSIKELGLPWFDDLEEREGIGAGGKYLRRVHLHGGLPDNSIPRLLDRLAATL